jgi:hypothetical protein
MRVLAARDAFSSLDKRLAQSSVAFFQIWDAPCAAFSNLLNNPAWQFEIFWFQRL